MTMVAGGGCVLEPQPQIAREMTKDGLCIISLSHLCYPHPNAPAMPLDGAYVHMYGCAMCDAGGVCNGRE